MIGECAWICRPDGVIRTTPIVEANRVSATQLRFETRNTRYILNSVSNILHLEYSGGMKTKIVGS